MKTEMNTKGLPLTAASSSDTRKTATRSVPILADSFTVTEWRLQRNHRLMILDEHDWINHEDERKWRQQIQYYYNEQMQISWIIRYYY